MELSMGDLVRGLIIVVGVGGIAFWARHRRAERNKKISDVLRTPAERMEP